MIPDKNARPFTEAWGIDAPLRRLEGGHRNQIFCTQGLPKNRVFKSTQRCEKAIFWLDKVHARAEITGFTVPRLQRSLKGNFVENGWTVEPFMKGRAFRQSELGALHENIEKFHALCQDIPQRPGFLSANSLRFSPKGGDVDLDKMPANLAVECRQAWRAFEGMAQSVVHGDLNCANVLKGTHGRAVLLDWDETRVDACIFDLAAIDDAGIKTPVLRAIKAWEIACSWNIEPAYAMGLAEGL
ncbi:MAG: phosphotransferase [Paracoccaceae bacterium]